MTITGKWISRLHNQIHKYYTIETLFKYIGVVIAYGICQKLLMAF